MTWAQGLDVTVICLLVLTLVYGWRLLRSILDARERVDV